MCDKTWFLILILIKKWFLIFYYSLYSLTKFKSYNFNSYTLFNVKNIYLNEQSLFTQYTHKLFKLFNTPLQEDNQINIAYRDLNVQLLIFLSKMKSNKTKAIQQTPASVDNQINIAYFDV